MDTQWRVGMNGATGLDYGVLPVVLRMVAVPRAMWAEVFDGVRVMETAALETMKKRKSK